MKPIIGITLESTFDPDNARSRGKMEINWNYPEEVAKAGGVPLLIPPTADMVVVADLIDGWLIPGGLDLDARLWQEDNHPKSDLQDGSRYDAEKRLFEAVSPELPILGICYGCQLLNVLLGGTLEQHVPDRTGTEDHTGGTPQNYSLEPDSRLAKVLSVKRLLGKSYHHQAVAKPGNGLKVVGRHADGTIEAIEAEGDRWLVGVQWHPERTPESAETQNLMRGFIEAALSYRTRRISSATVA